MWFCNNLAESIVPNVLLKAFCLIKNSWKEILQTSQLYRWVNETIMTTICMLDHFHSLQLIFTECAGQSTNISLPCCSDEIKSNKILLFVSVIKLNNRLSTFIKQLIPKSIFKIVDSLSILILHYNYYIIRFTSLCKKSLLTWVPTPSIENDTHGIERLLLKTQVSWTSSCIVKWIY